MVSSPLLWEPLPPRRKRKKKREAEESSFDQRARDNLAFVDDAVSLRSVQKRANPVGVDNRFEGCCYEHLDHTADVQFHAWGSNLGEALSSLGDCFFDFVTDRRTVADVEERSQSFLVEDVADVNALVFKVLDELLYRFSTDLIVCCKVEVEMVGELSARIETRGDSFDVSKHPQGTEVKAITYSNMQVHQKPGRTDIFVIVDI